MSDTWMPKTDAAVDERLGILSVRIPYALERTTESLATQLRRALVFTPDDISDFGIPLVRREVTQRDDGGFDVQYILDGHLDPDHADGEEFSLEGTTSEDPIESHQDILELIEKYSGTRDEQSGRVTWPSNFEDGEKNPLSGVSSYLVPGCVWAHTFVAKNFPAHLGRALGKIERPPVGRQGQRPPDEYDKSWMNIRFTAAWRGNIWRISRAWMLSGPGGWNPDIYRYK